MLKLQLNQPKYTFLFLLLFIGITPFLKSQQLETKKVLFVGNSFTYFFNMPQVVQAMADSQGSNLIARQSTVGGSSLEQHWKEEKDTQTRSILEKETFDYVVMNNHSLSPIENPDSFMEYGTKLAELIKSKGAHPVFFMTWAYKSNPLMQPKLTEMYQKLAEETGSGIVPVGLIWENVRQARPDLEIYHDDKHPSQLGTYLIALIFNKYFIGKSTLDIPQRIITKDKDGEKLYLSIISASDADFLKQMVEEFDFNTVSK